MCFASIPDKLHPAILTSDMKIFRILHFTEILVAESS